MVAICQYFLLKIFSLWCICFKFRLSSDNRWWFHWIGLYLFCFFHVVVFFFCAHFTLKLLKPIGYCLPWCIVSIPTPNTNRFIRYSTHDEIFIPFLCYFFFLLWVSAFVCIVFRVTDALYFFPIEELISAMDPYCCSVNFPFCQSNNIRFSGFAFSLEKGTRKKRTHKTLWLLKEVTLLFSDHKR